MACASNEKKLGMNLTECHILTGLLIFAVPIVLTGIIQQLYSLVDLIIIGQYMGSHGTVGVSTGGEMADMVTPIATAFATAGQIYIAQLVGGQEQERLRIAIGTLFTMMMGMAIPLMIGCIIWNSQILRLLNCPEDAFTQAAGYLIITALGFPFIFLYNAICGVLRGMGESKAPLVFIVIAAVINIFLDILFVAVFHMEAAGTAIATVSAQIGSCLAALCYLYRYREQTGLKFSLSVFRICGKDARVILGLGVPQAMRSVLVRSSMLWVNAGVNSYGLTMSATNSVGNKLQKFLDVFSTSLQQAASAMIGQNLGARKQKRAEQIVWYTFFFATALSVVIMAGTLLFPNEIFGLFTKDPEVLAEGSVYLRIMAVHFVLSAVVCAFQAMIIGCGNASMNFFIGILDGIVCKVGICLLLTRGFGMGAEGYFIGTAWSRALPAVVCILYYCSGRWKNRKLLIDSVKG